MGISLEGFNYVDASLQQIQTATVYNVMDEFPVLFQEGLGRSEGPPARVDIDPALIPKFLKARQVPLLLLSNVEEAIDKLVEQGILEPVRHSAWATPVLPILKNGNIRLCGGYKCTEKPCPPLANIPFANGPSAVSQTGWLSGVFPARFATGAPPEGSRQG